jgi:hypothetical protein
MPKRKQGHVSPTIKPTGAAGEEDEPPPKPKRNAARATLLRPVFDAKDKKYFDIKERTSTIQCSLIGRVTPEARALLDDLACYTSQVAQAASRLAAFVVQRRLQVLGAGMACLEQLLEPKDLNCGAAFFMDCLKWCAHGVASSDRVDEAEFVAFQAEFDVVGSGIRRDEFRQHVTSTLHTKRDEMCKDTKKHLVDAINTKPLLWLKHQLRKDYWDECLALSTATPTKSKAAVARDTIHFVAKLILAAAWADADCPPVLSGCPNEVVHALYAQMRDWVQLFRPYAHVADKPAPKRAKTKTTKVTAPPPAARRGIKKAPHVALWILSMMSRDFDEAGVARADVCRKYSDKAQKTIRGRFLAALPEWQQRAPTHFELIPNKPAHKVNFMLVTMSVAKEVVRLLWERQGRTDILPGLKEMHNDPFWWNRILQLDDDRGLISDTASYKQEWCTNRRKAIVEGRSTARFRAAGRKVKLHEHTRCTYLSRISGLATSQEHFEYLRAHTKTHPLILTSFRTNGRELHLIVDKSSVAANAPTDREPPTARRRSFGFDQLRERGFKALRDDTTDGEADAGCPLDLQSHSYGVYGDVVPTQRPVVAIVVDPGQINPLAYATVQVDASKADAELGALNLVPKAEFEDARGTTASTEWQARQAKENKQYSDYMKQLGEDSLTAPVGTSRAVAKLKTEASHWVMMSGLRTAMIHRDHSFKRKRQRKNWIRSRALRWKHDKVEVVCFGNGSCAARGHRRLPTKSLMHEIGTILPLVVLDEFGTSSRCPHCKTQAKLTRVLINQPTTQPVLQGADSLSTEDTRGEHCSQCNKTWLHDEVSVYNLAAVTQNMFIGTTRPKWLQRTQ